MKKSSRWGNKWRPLKTFSDAKVRFSFETTKLFTKKFLSQQIIDES